MAAAMSKLKNIPPALPASLAGFSPMELNWRLTLSEAAGINRFKDPETFKKHYPHLVKRIGKRFQFVTLYDALVLPPPDTS
jgi:hypothetical protein